MLQLFCGLTSKIVYLTLKVYFGVARRVGVTPSLPFFVPVSIRYNNNTARFYLKNQLDFDLLHDTFIMEEYKVDGIKSPRVIFDLGSNIGATVIFFKLLYPDAVVYAFEPDPQNIRALEKNVSQFGESVIVIEKAIVAESAESVTFYQANKHHWSSSTVARPEATKQVTVGAITLLEAMSEFGVDSIDVCKFDIEGGEYEVFRKLQTKALATWLLGEVHPTLFGYSKKEFVALFPAYELLEERSGEVVVMRMMSAK